MEVGVEVTVLDTRIKLLYCVPDGPVQTDQELDTHVWSWALDRKSYFQMSSDIQSFYLPFCFDTNKPVDFLHSSRYPLP